MPANYKFTFDEFFEDINILFSKENKLNKELMIAKDYFFKITGKIHDDDNDFSNRMNAFLLWFIFDWKISPGNRTPLDEYIYHLKDNNLEEDRRFVETQKKHLHSLFKLVKVENNRTKIRDIFTSKKYIINGVEYFIGTPKNTIFETRIFLINEKYILSNYVIFHPNITKKSILKESKLIKKYGSNKKQFLLKLHSFHTKWKRYRNINIKSIYHFDESVPAAK